MSKEVDSKVVSMEFDNSKFNKNVDKSVGKINKLKNSINGLSGKNNGFDAVEESAKRLDLSPIEKAVDTIGIKVSVMQVAFISAINSITNSIIRSAGQVVTAMTSLNAIPTGYSAYENKLSSMRTLLNIYNDMEYDDLANELSRLQWYTDETSYSFEAMTRAITSFGVAGINAADAISALEGFGNWAAGAGLSTSAANNIIDNIQRAVASERMTLQQWAGIQSSGMASTEFMEAAIEAALDKGYLKQSSNGKIKTKYNKDKKIKGGTEVNTKNFSSTLSSGWLTADVLTEALKRYSKYTDAIYEIVDSYDTCADAMEALDKQLEELNDSTLDFSRTQFKSAQEAKTFGDAINSVTVALKGTWAKRFEVIVGDVNKASNLWTSVADKLYDIFVGEDNLLEELEEWSNSGGRDTAISALILLLDKLGAVITFVKDAFKEVFPDVTYRQLNEWSSSFKELVTNINISEKTLTKIRNTLTGLFSIFKAFRKAISVVYTIFRPVIELAKILLKVILSITSFIGSFITKIVNGVGEVSNGVEDVTESVSPLVKVINNLGYAIKSIFTRASNLFDFLNPLFEFVSKTLNDVTKKLGSGEVTLESLVGTVASIIALIDTGRIVESIRDITETFSSFGDAFWSFYTVKLTESIRNIAISLLLFAYSLVMLSSVSADDISSVLVTLASGLAALVSAVKVLNELGAADGLARSFPVQIRRLVKGLGDNAKLEALAASMIQISVSILIMASALSILSKIAKEDLARSLIALFAILGSLILVVKQMSILSKNAKNVSKISGVMLMLGIAIGSFVVSVKVLSTIEPDSLISGLFGLTSIMLLMIGFTAAVDKLHITSKTVSTISLLSIAMSILSVAVAGMVTSVALMSTMNGDNLIKGIVGLMSIIGVMGSLAYFVKTVSFTAKDIVNLLAISSAMVIFSAAASGLAMAFAVFGAMSWDGLARAMTGMAIVLLEIYIITEMMGSNIASIGRAAAVAGTLIIFAAALNAMAVAMAAISIMSWEGLAKAGIAIVVMFGLFAGASYLMAPIAPVLLAVAGAVALFGVGLLATSIAIVTFIVSLNLMIGSFLAFGAVIEQVIVLAVSAFKNMIKGFINLIPDIIEALYNIVNNFLDMVITLTPKIVHTLVDILFNIIMEVLFGIRENIATIIDTVVDILIVAIDTLGDRLPDLMNSLGNFVTKIFKYLYESMLIKIRDFIPRFKEIWSYIVDTFKEVFGINSPSKVFAKLGEYIIEGLINGLKEKVVNCVNAIKGVGTRIIDGFKNLLGIESPSKVFSGFGGYIDKGLAQGISKNIGAVEKSSDDLANTASDRFSETIRDISNIIENGISDEMVIRPVIDLSEIQNGVSDMKKLFNDDYGISGSIENARSISHSMNNPNPTDNDQSGMDKILKNISNNNGNVYNTFNITSENAQEIAEEVSNILQKQVERRRMAWA